MNKKIILTVGISASGKSTWAAELVASDPRHVIVCRDNVRLMQGFPPVGSRDQEAKVTKICRGLIETALLDGFIPIVADTNINKDIRKQLIKFAHEHGADVEIVTFPISFNEAVERDSKRSASVGRDVIRKQFDRLASQDVSDGLIECPRFEGYSSNGSNDLPAAIVVDIDGTVATAAHRSVYDYTKVSTDEVIPDVANLVIDLNLAGNKVIFLSGREDSCREATSRWLSYHFFDMDFDLFMRSAGDSRPDWIIKGELYDKHVIPNYSIKAVLDDRDQVVRHVRNRGITVLQVNPGRF